MALFNGPEAWQCLQWLGRQSAYLGVAILLLACLRPLLMRAAGPRAVHAAWAALPVGLLALQLPGPPALPPLPLLQLVPQAWPAGAAGAARAAVPDGGWAPLLMGGWLAGVVLLLLLQWRAHGRMLQRLDRRRSVWRSPAGWSPALVGLWRPRLVLPSDFRQRFTPQEQRLVLAHEAAHGRRGDNAWTLAGRLLACLHWFNPLAWWALRRFAEDQELACDAQVLQDSHPSDLAPYARALLKNGEAPCLPRTHSPIGSPLAASWQTPHPLHRRILMLKTHAQHLTHARRGRLGAGLVAVLLAVLGQALQARTADPASASIDLRLNVQDQGALLGSPRLRVLDGQAAEVAFQPSGTDPASTWRIRLTPHARPDAVYDLELALYQGQATEPAARPRILVKAGESGRVEWGQDGHVLRIDLVAKPWADQPASPAAAAATAATTASTGRGTSETSAQ